MRLLCIALLGAALVSGSVVLRRSRSSSPEQNNQEIAAGVDNRPPLHDWLTAEQKAVLEPIRSDSVAFKKQVIEYYELLAAPEKAKWDAIYKEECTKWIKKVTSDEEYFELQALQKSDKSAADAKTSEYAQRLSEQERNLVNEWKDTCNDLTKTRSRRALTAEEKEWLSWLDEEKRNVIEKLHDANEDEDTIHQKIKSYFKDLPEDKQTELRTKFKGKCSEWLDEVATAEERAALKASYASDDLKEVSGKVEALFQKLSPERQQQLKKFTGVCKRLWNIEQSRSRRDIDPNFSEFTVWMTDDQKMTIDEMKKGGSTLNEIRLKTYDFFDALPDVQQKELKEKFKGTCKTYFGKISSPEEMDEIKSLHDAGNKDQIVDKIKAIIDKQPEAAKEVANKMQQICADVFAEKKTKRDIDTKIEKHLSWLTDAQKKEVKEMHASGVPKEEIKAKIFSYMNALDADAKKNAKELARKECYKWLEEAASKEEIDALHKLHETDHGACKTKIREYIARLPADKKAEVEKNLPFCEKVWYGEHDHSSHAGHHGHHRKRRHIAVIEKYIDWLTPEQKTTLQDLEKTNVDFDDIIAKVKEFYMAQSTERKEELKTKFKTECASWVKDIATASEIEELKTLNANGNYTQIKEKLAVLETRLTEDQKHTVEHVREVCLAVWQVKGASRRRRDHNHNLEEAFTKYLTWTTEDQKEELKTIKATGNKEAIYKKILEFFDATTGETRTKAAEELKGACKHYALDMFGEAKVAELKALKESGAAPDAMHAKINEFVGQIEDAEKKVKAEKLSAGCAKVYGAASRKRRDHHHHTLEDAFTKYLTWTTEDQKEELKTIKAAGNKEAIYKKILEFFDATTGETRTKAAEELKGACKHYALDMFGEAKVAELKALKESGAAPDAMHAKINEFVGQIEDAEKKVKAEKLSAGCAKVYGAASRKRRDHHHHTLEDAFTKYLTWTTEDQKEELKTIKAAGNKEAIYKKILEFFDATTGETRTKAAEELKGACKHYALDMFGEAKVAELKALKESGAAPDVMHAKINEFVGQIEDAEKKVKAEKLSAGCAKVYGAASRKRRDHHHHTLEDAFTKYLTWTTEDQKEELKTIKAAGNKEAIYKKILEFFDVTTGETRTKAAEELKGACKHYALDMFGEAKVAELKALKESGAAPDAMHAKINEFVGQIEDAEKKVKAEKLSAGCAKVYGAASRKRRDHHHHTLEDAFTKYLTWTTEDQKEELKTIKAAENKEAIYKKILEFFDATTGETRTKAAEELKGACKHYALDIFGEEKVAQIKAMKESGATSEQFAAKINEFVGQIDDAEKKAKAEKLTKGCQKVYAAAARKRRDNPHTIEDAFTWTTEDQKEELKTIKAAGDKEAIYKKILEFFDVTTGETRTKAAEELKGACKHYALDMFGEAKVAELKALKESGAAPDAMHAKINEFVGQIEDAEKKVKAEKLSAGCAKVYGAASRKRRDHHHHTLEDAFTKYLTWTTEDQKEELKTIKAAENKEAIYKKILEFFDATTGETRTKAAEELKGACKHYALDIFGEEKVAQIKAMKESGATSEQFAAKINEFVGQIDDAEKKAKAEKLTKGCQKVYAAAARKRRDNPHTIEDAFTWTTEDQKEELKTIKAAGDKEAIYKKILEFFDATTGETRTKAAEELKGACKHYASAIFGEAKVAELKALKESGAAPDAMHAKINEFVGQIEDAEKKVKAEKLSAGCAKVYGAASRKRRDHHHHTLEDAFTKYLTWTTEDQKEELKTIKAAGDKEAIYKKILEFFDATTGETRTKAAEELKGACKHYALDIFGEEKVAQIKAMKESGATSEQFAAKINEFVGQIDDAEKKAKAEKLTKGCQKVYAAAARKRRDHNHNTLEDAFTKYLTWTTDDQKEELKTIKAAGNKEAIYKKILEFFDATTGETRTKAAEELKGACKHYARDIFGEAKVAELKALKESGATPDVMKAKVNTFVGEVEDAEMKTKAQMLAAGCGKVFTAKVAKRHLYARHRRTGPEVLRQVLYGVKVWLTKDQIKKLQSLQRDNKETDFIVEVLNYYRAMTDKSRATLSVTSTCRAILSSFVQAGTTDELIRMIARSAPVSEVTQELENIFSKVSNQSVKTIKPLCVEAYKNHRVRIANDTPTS